MSFEVVVAASRGGTRQERATGEEGGREWKGDTGIGREAADPGTGREVEPRSEAVALGTGGTWWRCGRGVEGEAPHRSWGSGEVVWRELGTTASARPRAEWVPGGVGIKWLTSGIWWIISLMFWWQIARLLL